MKAIKIYLVVVTVLLVVAIGLGIYVWYKIQTFNAVIPVPVDSPSAQENIQTMTPSTSTSTPAPITVTTDSLTDTQKKMLETLGYTQDTFTITPAMIQCAEESVGKTRLDEIVGGGAPTPFESVKLLPCFK
jgi:hypothetical protein